MQWSFVIQINLLPCLQQPPTLGLSVYNFGQKKNLGNNLQDKLHFSQDFLQDIKRNAQDGSWVAKNRVQVIGWPQSEQLTSGVHSLKASNECMVTNEIMQALLTWISALNRAYTHLYSEP